MHPFFVAVKATPAGTPRQEHLGPLRRSSRDNKLKAQYGHVIRRIKPPCRPVGPQRAPWEPRNTHRCGLTCHSGTLTPNTLIERPIKPCSREIFRIRIGPETIFSLVLSTFLSRFALGISGLFRDSRLSLAGFRDFFGLKRGEKIHDPYMIPTEMGERILYLQQKETIGTL